MKPILGQLLFNIQRDTLFGRQLQLTYKEILYLEDDFHLTIMELIRGQLLTYKETSILKSKLLNL